VAIGRNEGERLIECLASVSSDTSNIVYVDSGSTDGSIAAAKEFGAAVVDMDLTRPFTAARARNEGFAALKARKPGIRLVQFIDGDCILVKGWFETAVAFLEQRKDVAVVCGRRRERRPTASVYNQLCDLEWDTPIGEASACGGDSLMRVEAFEAASGFRPQLIAGEEPELCVRLRERGWKIWRIDAEMTRHDAAMSRLGQWWNRAVRSGYGCAEVARLHWASPFGIWRRETARAVIWGGLVPVTIALGTLIHPAAIAGVLVYFLQICRIAFAREPTSFQSWAYAIFTTIGKFAAFEGILKLYWRQLHGQSATLIEYK
jgi:GT2 family glycosyltransferase